MTHTLKNKEEQKLLLESKKIKEELLKIGFIEGDINSYHFGLGKDILQVYKLIEKEQGENGVFVGNLLKKSKLHQTDFELALEEMFRNGIVFEKSPQIVHLV